MSAGEGHDNAARSLAALGHPVTALATVVWFANDHIGKSFAGGPVTGKLSDAAGLVVFPLLVAAVLARRARRPLLGGIAFTAVLFVAVNTIGWADALAEYGLSTLWPARLTADPTDLLLVPVLIVPAAVWRIADPTRWRRAWARFVFAAGVVTTLATGQPIWESDTLTGTLVLTEDQPVVDLPYEILVDGSTEVELDSQAEFVREFEVTFYGSGPADDPRSAVVERLVETDAGSVVRWELRDLSLAPAEVAWTMVVRNPGHGGLLFSKKQRVPTLTVGDPATAGLPAPAAFWKPGSIGQGAPRKAAEFSISSTTGARLVVKGFGESVDGVRAATISEPISTVPGRSVAVPRPSHCRDGERCRFALWVSVPSALPEIRVELFVDGDPDAEVGVTQHRYERVETDEVFGPHDVDGMVDIDLTLGVHVVGIEDDPRRHATEFVAIDVESWGLGGFDEPTRDTWGQNCCRPDGPLGPGLFPLDRAALELHGSGVLGGADLRDTIEFRSRASVWWLPVLAPTPAVDLDLEDLSIRPG